MDAQLCILSQGVQQGVQPTRYVYDMFSFLHPVQQTP